MITVNRVTKTYTGVPAVLDASFAAPQASVVGLLGPNGAGKSTLMRMMTAYLAPSSGEISVMGHDTILESPLARAAIGYLPESTPLYPEMTPVSYLRFRAGLYGLPRKARKNAVNRVIEQCWLGPVRSRRIGALSKGYRQRVGLAAALIHDPPVLILDEPSAGLDPAQAREMRSLIRSLAATRTVLISSHILTEVERVCDRVVILARGRVLADATPAELLGTTRREITVAYRLRSSPTPRPNSGSESHGSSTPIPADQHRVLMDHLRRLRGVLSCDAVASGSTGDEGSTNLNDALGVRRLRLACAASEAATDELGESIAQAVIACGGAISELHPVRPSLESVFLRLIESDGPVDSAAHHATVPGPAHDRPFASSAASAGSNASDEHGGAA